MIQLVLLIIVALFLTGNIRIEGFTLPYIELFQINGQIITVTNVLMFFLILMALGLLPSPVKEIAAILFVLWLLSMFGIIAIAGFSNILVIAIIVGIVFSLFKR